MDGIDIDDNQLQIREGLRKDTRHGARKVSRALFPSSTGSGFLAVGEQPHRK